MQVCTLLYCGRCDLELIVDIHGVEKEVTALVDTGFCSETGYGLQLPANYVNYAMATGTGYVTVADGREVAVASIPDAKIVQIGQYRLKNPIPGAAIFTAGPETEGTVGVLVLQQMYMIFDGPNMNMKITFNNE